MGNITLQDLIEVVKQPDYSKQKLLVFQERYHLDTVQFIDLYKEGIPLPVIAKDIENWLFHFDMFNKTGGNIFELVNDPSFDDCDTRLDLIA